MNMKMELIRRLEKHADQARQDALFVRVTGERCSDKQRQHAKAVETRAYRAIDMILNDVPEAEAWKYFQAGE